MPRQSIKLSRGSENSTQSSPLLALPAEIRNQIWETAFSNHVIHISVRDCPLYDIASYSYSEYHDTSKGKARPRVWGDDEIRNPKEATERLKFTHAVCYLPLEAEDKAYELNRSVKDAYSCRGDEIPGEDSYCNRHTRCYGDVLALKRNWTRDGDHVFASSQPRKVSTVSLLPVQLLRACRQIYREANHLLYATNTFAFHEGFTLGLFITKALSRKQSSQIRIIQTDGWISVSGQPVSIPREKILKLSGLRSLQAWMIFPTQCIFWGFKSFKHLKLDSVRLILSQGPGLSPSSSSPKQRIVIANKMEEKLKTGVEEYYWPRDN